MIAIDHPTIFGLTLGYIKGYVGIVRPPSGTQEYFLIFVGRFLYYSVVNVLSGKPDLKQNRPIKSQRFVDLKVSNYRKFILNWHYGFSHMHPLLDTWP
jgi:hypothetical protein